MVLGDLRVLPVSTTESTLADYCSLFIWHVQCTALKQPFAKAETLTPYYHPVAAQVICNTFVIFEVKLWVIKGKAPRKGTSVHDSEHQMHY